MSYCKKKIYTKKQIPVMKLITALGVYVAAFALCSQTIPIDVPLASFKAKFFSIEYQYPLYPSNKTASTFEDSNISSPVIVPTDGHQYPYNQTVTTIKKKLFSSCAELFLNGNKTSGVYTISPKTNHTSFDVFCDMQTNGGGWTVFQKRDNYVPLENFTRNWNEYKNGFGELNKDFWLGNDHLFILTNQEIVELRVDLEDFKGNKKWAQYSQFRIQDENNSYESSILGYNGDAGDSLKWPNNQVFSTYDKDSSYKCANQSKGGWWYYTSYCWDSNLNGFYFKTNAPDIYQGTALSSWEGSEYSLKKTEMKIRPANFLST